MQRLDDVPEDVRKAAERFVETKYSEDVLIATTAHQSRALIRTRSHDIYWDPWQYVQACFPFSMLEFAPHTNEPAFVTAVPTRQTLGYSWRWRTSDIAEDERAALIETLQKPPASVDQACYTWIRPLGIFAPHEGKNRVDFLRECGISTIPAWVAQQDYPAADRIKLYNVRLGGRQEQWAVLDDQWVQREPELFDRALPVLEAYGVRPATDWPSSYPAPLQVCAEFERLHTVHEDREPIVDLRSLREDGVDLFCAVSELEGVHLRPRFWGLSLSLIAAGTLVLATLPQRWAELRELAAVCCGVGLGSMGFVLAPMLRARGRLLLPQARGRARRARKRA